MSVGAQQALNEIGKEIYNVTGKIQEKIKINEKVEYSLQKTSPKLYELHKAFGNEKYIQNLISKTPKKYWSKTIHNMHELTNYMVGIDKAANKFLETSKSLDYVKGQLYKLHSNPTFRSERSPDYANLKRQEMELTNKYNRYQRSMRIGEQKFLEIFYNMHKRAGIQVDRHERGGEKLGAAIAAVVVTIFGGSVLYALSSTPADSYTGAFAAGASTPIFGMTIIGAALFALFFLTHHKLK